MKLTKMFATVVLTIMVYMITVSSMPYNKEVAKASTNEKIDCSLVVEAYDEFGKYFCYTDSFTLNSSSALIDESVIHITDLEYCDAGLLVSGKPYCIIDIVSECLSYSAIKESENFDVWFHYQSNHDGDIDYIDYSIVCDNSFTVDGKKLERGVIYITLTNN